MENVKLVKNDFLTSPLSMLRKKTCQLTSQKKSEIVLRCEDTYLSIKTTLKQLF